MLIHNYHPVSGEYTGSEEAELDPLDQLPLIPGHATIEAPPPPVEGRIRVYMNNSWGYVTPEAPQQPSTEPQPPTVNEIIAERDERLARGFRYDFGVDDPRGVHFIETSVDDMKSWDEVSKLSTAAILMNQPETTIGIKTGNGPILVTAQEWQSILLKAGEVRQPIFHASFVLQAMDPRPMDYKDDSYWS